MLPTPSAGGVNGSVSEATVSLRAGYSSRRIHRRDDERSQSGRSDPKDAAKSLIDMGRLCGGQAPAAARIGLPNTTGVGASPV